ncbi:ABC transporter permease [Planotetraspora phitsanulokensis]|uniref:Transport permease protein n=1 Tax=Planotetraspora phitsanulokensis TaxID=575192 RepID=A0A8J3UGH4_9ACTN|nr:ABC transporter permease [Planotetraspora phitsanulokensis]GII38490.1 transport permease protein [Planotetraspora phitsanulokensis]
MTSRNTFAQGMTLTWRSLVPLRNQPGELIQLLLQPIFMIVIFVVVFGAMSGDQGGAVQRLLPGVLTQVALTQTITTGMRLAEDIGNGVFDRFRSMPIARSAPLMGRILADTATMTLTIAVALLVGAAVGFRIRTSPLEALGGVALLLTFTLSLGWVSAWLGLRARSAASMQGMATAVLLPLTFGSTALIPAANLPGVLRWWANLNPVSHLADSLRALLTGGPVGAHVWITLGWCTAIAACFVPLAVRTYARRIR